MTTAEDPYADIAKVCPACGLANVWLCSAPDCPKGKEQTETRKGWLDRQNQTPEEQERNK